MTLSAELVSEWIDAFPITVHVSDRVDYIYSDDQSGQYSHKQHKEELKHRRVLDSDDRHLVDEEVQKYPHPLEDHRPYLYNPVTGQIANDSVNVADSLVIGNKLESKYIASLPKGFTDPISTPIKTMDVRKHVKSSEVTPVIDPENILIRLLLVGQRRQMELGLLFAYELCTVPP